MDWADVRVKERRGGPSLVHEPGPVFLAGDGVWRQELERHGPAEGEILGPVDDTHPPLAELREDLGNVIWSGRSCKPLCEDRAPRTFGQE